MIQAEPAKKRKRKVQFDQPETEEKTINMKGRKCVRTMLHNVQCTF